MDPQARIQQTLSQQANPGQFVQERLLARAFETDTPFQDDRYLALTRIEPAQIGDEYKGDAHDFVTNTLQGPYNKLQDLIKRLAQSVQAEPFPGEHITSFIERVAGMAATQAQQAQS